MKYTFSGKLIQQGTRYFIEIPFNIWEEWGRKGLIPVKVCIQDYIFECRLVPKGRGVYYIPVKKQMADQLGGSNDLGISFEVISGLTRINHDSPYSKENPVRKIDGIKSVTYPKSGYCGQICIAMLTGLSVEEVIDIMQSKAWQCSFSKLLETLDYFGISHDDKVIYTRGREFSLPDCCIVNVRADEISHFVLYYKGNFYDSSEIDPNKIIGYLRILTE